ncbi:MAG: thiamine pyrophosphate-dependent dehydrogenase E1 component subunit alpha [Bacillota bacterium]|nr:thiamine pyrophosphate-dependent dehydrogenase E1 component subunit alpha [Bacillota bacterium]
MHDGLVKVAPTLQQCVVDRNEDIGRAGRDALIGIYRGMVRSRCLDEKIEELLEQGFSITQHSAVGQEATPIATCAALSASDYVMPYHRGWAWAIGRGMQPGPILAELMGKATGYCKGKGGPHLASFEHGVLGRSGIQGAHISIAAGVGLSAKMRGSGQVVACFFGNGASNTGSFHEGLNLAAVWRAPVVFVCENNLYALYSTLEETTSVSQIAYRAAGYGMTGYIVDGNDAILVHHVARKAIEDARAGAGPTLIEAMTYRWSGHTALDRQHYGGYRPKDEVDEWKRRCPIKRLGGELTELRLATEDELEGIWTAAREEMAAAAQLAIESPYPAPQDYSRDIYAV